MNEIRFEILIDNVVVAKDVTEELMPDFVKYIFDKYYEERNLQVTVRRHEERENKNEY